MLHYPGRVLDSNRYPKTLVPNHVRRHPKSHPIPVSLVSKIFMHARQTSMSCLKTFSLCDLNLNLDPIYDYLLVSTGEDHSSVIQNYYQSAMNLMKAIVKPKWLPVLNLRTVSSTQSGKIYQQTWSICLTFLQRNWHCYKPQQRRRSKNQVSPPVLPV